MQSLLQWTIDLARIPSGQAGELREQLYKMLHLHSWPFAESSSYYGEEGDIPNGEMPISVFIPLGDEETLLQLNDELVRTFPNLKVSIVSLDDALWQNAWSQSESVSFVTQHFSVNQLVKDHSKLNLKFSSSELAFGDGRHVSTRLILGLLDKRLSCVTPIDTMLDVGCGNGILAIAAALYGVPRVVATDLDQFILDTAMKYAIDHGIANRISFVNSDQIPHGQFPLVCANILAPALIALAKDLCRALESGGRILLAGFQQLELEQILEAFCELRLEGSVSDQGWLAIELSKP